MGLGVAVKSLPLVLATTLCLVACLEKEGNLFEADFQSFRHGVTKSYGLYGMRIPSGKDGSVGKKVRVVSIRKKGRFEGKEPKGSGSYTHSSPLPLYHQETNSKGRLEFKHLDKYVSPTAEPMHVGFGGRVKDVLLSNPSQHYHRHHHHHHLEVIPAKVTEIPSDDVKSSTSIYFAHEPSGPSGGEKVGFSPSPLNSLHLDLGEEAHQHYQPPPGLPPKTKKHFGPIPVSVQVVPSPRVTAKFPAYPSQAYYSPAPEHYNPLHVVYPFGYDYKNLENVSPFQDFALSSNHHLPFAKLGTTSSYYFHHSQPNRNHLSGTFGESHKGI